MVQRCDDLGLTLEARDAIGVADKDESSFLRSATLEHITAPLAGGNRG
jgi:hypothetical protein